MLVLTSQKDRYGYELVEQISQKFAIAEGTIYPLLRRLAADGLFSTYLSESEEGPPRKYYKITDEGRRVMHDMIEEWNAFAIGVQEIIKGDRIE